MEENLSQRHDNQDGPYKTSLLAFLEQHPKNVNFKLYDWIRTVDSDSLAGVDSHLCGIYECAASQTLLTPEQKDLVEASLVASAAERPEAPEETLVEGLFSLVERFNDVAHWELEAREGWIIVTERIGIWPSEQQSYEVTQRGKNFKNMHRYQSR